jgi:glycosyltransferase involved in cell wall biosynthesis
MRIAHLSFSQIPSRKANAVQVMRMCAAFAGLGHDVTLYARPGSEVVDDVFAYYNLPPRFEIVRSRRPAVQGLGELLYAARVARQVRARPVPDVFFSRDIFSLAAVAPMGRDMIFEAHAMPSGLVSRQLEAWLFRRPAFRRLVTVSEGLAQDYARLFPWLPRSKVLAAPNGVMLPAGQPGTPADLAGFRNAGRFNVGYVGQLYPGKGMEVIVGAARRLPDAVFHVVGGTPPLLEAWRARKAELPDNLHFHGFVPPVRTEAFRQAMDALILASQAFLPIRGQSHASWMSPIKMFEYMASRKPIVASDLPVIREVLSDNVNALLVPPADLDAWAGALRRLAGDAGLRERLAAQAFHDVQARHTVDRRAQAVLEGIAG